MSIKKRVRLRAFECLAAARYLPREEVGQREELHLVERASEEDAVEHEGEAEAEGQARAVPPAMRIQAARE